MNNYLISGSFGVACSRHLTDQACIKHLAVGLP